MAHRTARAGPMTASRRPTSHCSWSAGILLAIPIVALLWVSSYARETPEARRVPFFFWYQFLWVFITAALTYAAHRLVLAARQPEPVRRAARPRTTGDGRTSDEPPLPRWTPASTGSRWPS